MEKNKLKLDMLPFGGDYCPEQWSEEIWQKDIEYMHQIGVNTVTINVHSWIVNQPSEDIIDFSFLDKIVSLLSKANIKIIMATSTTCAPAWLYQKDSGTLKTDIQGRKQKHGVREHFCPTSKNYREAVEKMVKALAKHYKNEQNIFLWHLNNEFAGFCYCESCEKHFRQWLKKKYKTIENLNQQWCSVMWGRKYTSFEDIYAPTELNEVYVDAMGPGTTIDSLPTEAIEYSRFMSDMHKELLELEATCIKDIIPNAVCTNNFQFRGRFDYHRMATPLDIVSYDCYPNKREDAYEYDFNLDIARNLQNQDQPFLIMEMTPNHGSWSFVCSAKRPGEVGRIAMDCIAHGANSSLYFQIRRTPAGFEKFHGAMISHCGHLDTRIAKELTSYSNDLKKIPLSIQTQSLNPEVAIIHDWDEKLGVEIPCTVRKLINYSAEVKHYYRYFHDNNYNIDVISLNQDFNKYKLIVAPMITMIREEYAKKLEEFVSLGGTLVLTYLSGYTNECDYMYLGGQPGPLRKVAGLWIEEIDGLADDECNTMVMSDNTELKCSYMCDVIRTETAETLATYKDYFYKGQPCLTKNKFGKGSCYYIGSKLDKPSLDILFNRIIQELKLKPIMTTPDKVYATQRGNLTFVINHSDDEKQIELAKPMHEILSDLTEKKFYLKPQGYLVLEN